MGARSRGAHVKASGLQSRPDDYKKNNVSSTVQFVDNLSEESKNIYKQHDFHSPRKPNLATADSRLSVPHPDSQIDGGVRELAVRAAATFAAAEPYVHDLELCDERVCVRPRGFGMLGFTLGVGHGEQRMGKKDLT